MKHPKEARARDGQVTDEATAKLLETKALMFRFMSELDEVHGLRDQTAPDAVAAKRYHLARARKAAEEIRAFLEEFDSLDVDAGNDP